MKKLNLRKFEKMQHFSKILMFSFKNNNILNICYLCSIWHRRLYQLVFVKICYCSNITISALTPYDVMALGRKSASTCFGISDAFLALPLLQLLWYCTVFTTDLYLLSRLDIKFWAASADIKFISCKTAKSVLEIFII